MNIPIDNPIKYAKPKDIINIFKSNGEAIVYFGNPECLYCRSAVPVLIDAANKNKVEVLYYLDISNQDGYQELYDILLDEVLTDGKIEGPLVIFIVNGQISGYNKGTVYSHRLPFIKMNDDMTEGLYRIYESGIKDVMEIMKIKEDQVAMQ